MSIQLDDTATGLSDADAIAALTGTMSRKGGAPATEVADEDDDELDEDEGPEVPEDHEDDDANDDDADEDADNDEDDEDGQKEPAPAPEVSDDTVVKVTVDGQEQELTVGSLKRLAGQEASLTRKSQEADTIGQRAAATLQGALETVLEDMEAYSKVDWVLEGNRMDPEEFAWHREQFSKLTARRDKLVTGAQNLEQTITARRDAQLQADAVEAVRVLADPKTGIEGWNDELYDSILEYAVSSGLPQDEVATIVNPSVIKLINKARLYDAGKKATAEKVNLTPRRTRTGGGSEPIAAPEGKAQKALERKLASGRATDDDAVAALMGRWGVRRSK